MPATAVPVIAATVRGAKASVFVVRAGVARANVVTLLGERAGVLYLDPKLVAGSFVVTEGRGQLDDGDRVAARWRRRRRRRRTKPRPRDRAARPRRGSEVTELSLKNPIAVLMACIGLIVFAAVVTPRMSVDTFPDLTPPVLVVGTLAPGLGAKDVEKTLTWRIEKYASATPGVDHVESVSRNNLSVVYVWLAWGTNLDAAQTLVQQQVQFAMSAVPKSLGILPPFVLQYDPSNAPVVQVAVYGGGLYRCRSSTTPPSTTSSRSLEGHSRRRERRAQRRGTPAPDQRHRRPGARRRPGD